MSNITEYGKILIRTEDNRYLIFQPKSWTHATKRELQEVLDLVFDDEYDIVRAAVPKYMVRKEE